MLLAKGDSISLEDLPEVISGLAAERNPQFPTPAAVEDEQLRVPSGWLQQPLREAREKLLAEFERAYLVGLLEATQGRIGETAERAGIRPRSLYEKMKRLGLAKEDFRPKRRRSLGLGDE